MNALVTPDGWRVEIANYDGTPMFKVTHNGILPPGGVTMKLRDRGKFPVSDAGVAQVKLIMGAAFATLEEERNAS